MRYVLYIFVVLTGFTILSNGFNLFAESGRTGESLVGTISAVAFLYLIGGLIVVPGLIGLVMKKDWGRIVAAIGMAMGFLASVLTITVGTLPVLQFVLPLVSTILLFVVKK